MFPLRNAIGFIDGGKAGSPFAIGRPSVHHEAYAAVFASTCFAASTCFGPELALTLICLG